MRRLPLIIILSTCLAGVAEAQADDGPYVAIFAGPNFLPSYDLELGDEIGEVDPDYETGYNVGGVLGYRFNDFLRIEGEIGYQRHELALDGASGVGLLVSDLDGDAEILSGVVNAYIDGDFGLPLRPFLGVGGGLARVALNDLGLAVTTPELSFLPPQTLEVGDLVNDEDILPAAQLILGMGYALTEHITAAASYRLFVGFDAEFETAAVDGLVEAERFGGDFYSHAARLGLRYRF